MNAILVPTDFSKNAYSALRYAILLSRQMQRPIVVFHCSQISAYALSAAGSQEQMTALLKEDEQNKMEKVEEQVRKAYKSIDFSPVAETTKCVVAYNPLVVEKTLAIAEKYEVGLIVMGTHGASGITKFFFGSNTSVMISKSNIPVLAIPEGYKFKGMDEVLYASDLENTAAELNTLLPFVKANNAVLNLLYLDYGLDPDNTKIEKAHKTIAEAGYPQTKLIVKKANIETSLVSQLKIYLQRKRPSCLAMFTRERTLWDRLFLKGSKTEDMSAKLSIPLLSFKKK